jgi:hypothetical protein
MGGLKWEEAAMKYLSAPVPVVLLPLVILFSSQVSAIEFECGTPDTTAGRGTYGGFKPHTGDTKALVIFVKFSDDTYNDSCYNYWPSARGDTLPSWAMGDSLIHSDTTTEDFIEGSLSHFWHAMSQDSFCYYGDVYPRVFIPPNGSWYYTYDYNWEYLNWYILTQIDTQGYAGADTVDFSQYDNNPRDGVVDAIQICYRRWPQGHDPPGQGYAKLADSGWPSTCTWPIVTNDSLWIEEEGESSYVAVIIEPYGSDEYEGSGTTQEVIVTRHIALQVMAHEWGHYLIGYYHPTSWAGCWCLMDENGGGIAMCGLERLLLDWVTPLELDMDSDTTGVTLGDALTTGDLVKVLADTSSAEGKESYYLIENRQPVSYYDKPDTTYPSNCDIETPGRGILVSEVYWLKYLNQEYTYLDVKCADGRFNRSSWEPDAF